MLIHCQQAVSVFQAAIVAAAFHRGPLAAHSVGKLRPAHSLPRQQSQIMTAQQMSFIRQAVGVLQASRSRSQSLRFHIHQLHKVRLAAHRPLSDSKASVVGGFQQRGVQKLPQSKALARQQARAAFTHRRRLRRNLTFPLQRRQIQAQQSRQNLGGAGWRQRSLAVMLPKHLPGLRIQQQSPLSGNAWLRPGRSGAA